MKFIPANVTSAAALLILTGCNLDSETAQTLGTNQPQANNPTDSTGNDSSTDAGGADQGQQQEQPTDSMPRVRGRVARITLDYDNNGVMDAVENISYDSQGRVRETQFNYIGDSSADVLAIRGASDTLSLRYDYDAADRVSVSILRSSSTNIRSVYSYGANGEVTRITSTSPGSNPQDPDLSTPTNFSYANGRPQTIALTTPTVEIELPGQQPLIAGGNIIGQAFVYGSNGLPSSATSRVDSDQTDSRSFTWRDDGQLAELQVIRTTGGSESVGLLYNSDNQLIARIFTTTDAISSYTPIPENGSELLSYDNQNRLQSIRYDVNSDGSIEASMSIEWEDENCLPAFIFAMNALPNFILEAGSPFVPGTGFLTPGLCDTDA